MIRGLDMVLTPLPNTSVIHIPSLADIQTESTGTSVCLVNYFAIIKDHHHLSITRGGKGK